MTDETEPVAECAKPDCHKPVHRDRGTCWDHRFLQTVRKPASIARPDLEKPAGAGPDEEPVGVLYGCRCCGALLVSSPDAVYGNVCPLCLPHLAADTHPDERTRRILAVYRTALHASLRPVSDLQAAAEPEHPPATPGEPLLPGQTPGPPPGLT